MNDLRGSIWRRCDLHVHTPESILHSEYGTNWDQYVKELITKAVDKHVEIIGITDYFTIEGYKKLKSEYLDNKSKMNELFKDDLSVLEKSKSILFLPNIEFRLNRFVNKHRVNFHVIFSDEVSINDIEENFLHNLNIVCEGNICAPDWKRKLKLINIEKLGEQLKEQQPSFTDSAIKEGMKNVTVDDSELMTILHGEKAFNNKYLTVVPCDEDLSKIDWKGQDHNARKVIIQKSNMLFSANPSTIKWGLGDFSDSKDEYIKEFKSIKPCIHGSDAHSFDKLFEPDLERYCWIKADPTFEGVQQVLYEPLDRVKITNENPNYEYDKPFFESLEILSDCQLIDNEELKLKTSKIPFNKNLVSIIGGRGSGKSMLINTISNIYGKSKLQGINKTSSLNMIYGKNNSRNPELISFSGDNDNALDFLFISQGDLRELLLKPKKFDAEIVNLLDLSIQNTSYELQNELDELNNELANIRMWFNKTDEENNLINTLEYNTSLIEYNNTLLENITTKENEIKLKSYSNNIEIMRSLEKDIRLLNNISSDFIEFANEVNKKILTLNSDYQVPTIDFSKELDKIKSVIEQNNKDIESIKKNNNDIKESFQNVYTGDLTTLLSSVDKYKTLILDAEKRSQDIKDKEISLIEKKKERNEICRKIKNEYVLNCESIDNKWATITDKFNDPRHKSLISKILYDRNIEINGHIRFDKEEFIKGLKTYLNLTQYRKTIECSQEEKIFADFPISNYHNYFDFMTNCLDVILFEEENISKVKDFEGLEKWFYDLTNRSKYLYVAPIVKYKGKTIDKLSAGQKGTMYLCIKLATNAFSSPIIFDQPEDDLDNEFIIDELVSIIKELKIYRQIIIVTHNANLVVNADSEQVIIANNNDENLTYISGALEKREIIENVCRILEGGKAAFQNRRSKYFHFIQ